LDDQQRPRARRVAAIRRQARLQEHIPTMKLRLLFSPGMSVCDRALPGATILGGAVGAGGRNAHRDVLAVQAGLNAVPPCIGRPAVALAVDGILGPKTQAAINGFQAVWLSRGDGRIDRDGPTLRALNRAAGAGDGSLAYVAARAGPLALGPVALAAGPQLAPRARTPTTQEMALILAAAARLVSVRSRFMPELYKAAIAAVRVATRATAHAERLPAPGVERMDPDRLAFLLLAKHFKLHENNPAAAKRAARRVEKMLRRIAITLAGRVGKPLPGMTPLPDLFVCLWRTPPDVGTHPGYTWAGGMHERHRAIGTFHAGEELGRMSPDVTDRIYLTPHFDKGDDEYHSHVLVHELGHFVGDVEGGAELIEDLGYTYEERYRHNTSLQRLGNADAYACFVRECYFGTTRAAKGAQITVERFGPVPIVNAAEEPLIAPKKIGEKDRFDYPAGF
jgi:hypothetical protein